MPIFPHWLWLLLAAGLLSSCHTAHYNFNQPEQNGAVIMRIKRTPCYGACPVFEATLYENGLLLYQGKRFTFSLGCHYCVVSKKEIKKVKQWFDDADFFYLKNKYPEEDIAPTDLPDCFLTFNTKKQQKTILDRGWNTPEALTTLETKIDTWISIQNLQPCDK